jgi:putative radical SAM enzyme (TIGR03279 family)
MKQPEQTPSGGVVKRVEGQSLADELGVQPGDVLLAVNDQPVVDVIDVQYFSAEYEVELKLRRGEQTLTLAGRRREMQPLGIEFEHPTFDIDIRRCNNLCPFCFVLQMAPRFRRTLYIKDDDYRYSFLYGHFVTLTNLSEHDERRIVEQHLSPLYVSVHATDLEVRRQVLRNDKAPDIIQQLHWLADSGIEVHTQLVITPGLNDGEHLERSVRDLAELYPGVRSVSVVPVGLTKYHRYGHRPNTLEESHIVLETCHRWQAEFRARFGVNFVYPTDEWYLVTNRPLPTIAAIDGLDLTENGLGVVRRFLDDWQEVKNELSRRPKVNHLTLATATLFAPTLSRIAAEFSELSRVRTDITPVVNQQLGETITVAGLLMGQDVINQLSRQTLGDVVVLPRVMFDHPDGVSLDDHTPDGIAQVIQRPVALVDLMGDLVDIIYGRPALYFEPGKGRIPSAADIASDGGWSVEKYL